jgi:prevent-host-death family protein
MYITYIMTMKAVNIAELKGHLSEFLDTVEHGEEVQVCRRNQPIARILPFRKPRANRTRLGCARGSVTVHGDLTEPLVPESSWEMLGPESHA